MSNIIDTITPMSSTAAREHLKVNGYDDGSIAEVMAEWEEIQALTIAWEGFTPILTEIVRNSVDECKVIIACDDQDEVESYLQMNGVETANVEYLEVPTNSIWMRDYGQNTIYKDDVDSLYLVDWIYNRPREDDDKSLIKV